MSSGYGLIDSSSLLRNSYQVDTSTEDSITELQTQVTSLQTLVNTQQNEIDQLRTELNDVIALLRQITSNIS